MYQISGCGLHASNADDPGSEVPIRAPGSPGQPGADRQTIGPSVMSKEPSAAPTDRRDRKSLVGAQRQRGPEEP
jgi:hypothetical protein